MLLVVYLFSSPLILLSLVCATSQYIYTKTMSDEVSGLALLERSVAFAVHGDLPLPQLGRIINIREEMLSADDFPPEHVRLLSPDGGDTGSDEDEGDADPYANPIRLVTIERSASTDPSTLDTVCHSYSLHAATLVITYLESICCPILAEDAVLLAFFAMADSAGSPSLSSQLSSAGGSSSRIDYRRKVVPLMNENALMREALGLPRQGPLTESQITAVKGMPSIGGSGIHAARGAAKNRADRSRSEAPADLPEVSDITGSTSVVNAARPTDATQQQSPPKGDPFGVHSPHLWEQETAAARNARTKYKPFRNSDKKGSSNRGAKLDQVTQQHLVCRLHDKSLDSILKFREDAQEHRDGGNGHHEGRALSYEEQQNLGTRLHDQQVAKKATMMADLEKKLHPDPERRFFSKKDIETSNERIYREPMQKKQKGLEQLIQKYVLDEDAKIPKKKLSRVQQQTMADRLSSSKA
jgi:hypothetical protein